MSTSKQAQPAERVRGLPRGKTVYDGGDWRIIRDGLNLRWHVVEYVCRDRGVDRWRSTYSACFRNDLAEYLALSRDLPKDAERVLIDLPALMQSDAGKADEIPREPPAATKQTSAVILQHGDKLRVIADERKQKWVVQTRTRRGRKPGQWQSRDFCDNRRFLIECVADRLVQTRTKGFPDLGHLPPRFGADTTRLRDAAE